MPCEDVARDDLALVAFLNSWDTIQSDWPSNQAGGAQFLIAALRAHGCAFLSSTQAVQQVQATIAPWGVPYLQGGNLCVEEGMNGVLIKPLSYFCPASCGW